MAEAYAKPTPGFSHVLRPDFYLLEGLSRKAYAEKKEKHPSMLASRI
jgi:hypothetical protein